MIEIFYELCTFDDPDLIKLNITDYKIDRNKKYKHEVPVSLHHLCFALHYFEGQYKL